MEEQKTDHTICKGTKEKGYTISATLKDIGIKDLPTIHGVNRLKETIKR